MISLIVAVAENGVIGDRNALLWHISEDLRHFKAVTTGHPVVMGRKTWESLGRPLPNRTNVVITRQNIEIPGCTVVHSLEEAVALFPADEEVFVIGGAQIYAAALPLARKFYLTRVFRAYEGDTRFPAWDEREWRLVSSESFSGGKDYPWPFAFELYDLEHSIVHINNGHVTNRQEGDGPSKVVLETLHKDPASLKDHLVQRAQQPILCLLPAL